MNNIVKRMARVATAAACVLMLANCSQDKGWKVSGTIVNAPAGAKVAVDAFNGVTWYALDSAKVAKNGSFAYTAPAPAAYPDVYRITLDGKSIYFPINGTDRVEVKAYADNFDSGYVLSGTPSAQSLMQIDQRIANAAANGGAKAVMADSALRVDIVNLMLADTVGTVSYYLLNKTIGREPLFTYETPLDVKILGAVANKFSLLYPNDPRTGFLKDRFVNARRQMGMGLATVIEANESGLFEIELPDASGTMRKLSETANNAGVTLLSFTAYGLEMSPAYNVELNRLYEKYKGNNIAIYQVSLDDDEVLWSQAAINLPWVAVRNNPVNGAALINTYMVDQLPLTFVIDGNGDIVERVADATELESAINRVIKK